MKVYIYDPITKEFLYEYSPQKNPKNPQEYLFPQFSTQIKPEKIENMIPVFDGNNWKYEPDFRNQEIINLETKVISKQKELGEVEEGFMLYEDYKTTNEYLIEQHNIEIQAKENQIKSKMAELDIKRIRAFLEPEQKTEEQTWLEFYTNQIVNLRNELKELR